MIEAFLDTLAPGLDSIAVLGLFFASFVGSFITIAMGIGGGALLLAVMASLMPPAALIPVHGLIQIGSNFSRVALLVRHIHWPPMAGFAVGSLTGVALGGLVVVDLPGHVIQIGVGVFVIWSVLMRPPAWLSAWPWVTGALSSFLTMFFGATGVFVANFTKSLKLPRQGHVATHASFMTLQHGFKIVAFGLLGFSFAPWVGFIIGMILSGVAGTFAGRFVLVKLSDATFKRALDIILILISIRLIWSGLTR